MLDFTQDELERTRFDWPDALIIEVIGESYGSASASKDRLLAARLHSQFLRALFETDRRDAAYLRVELIACCAARNIGLDDIETADYAAFRELTSLVDRRFRYSTRLRMHFTQRLCNALGRLPRRVDPPKPTAPAPVLTIARRLPIRPGAILPRKRAVNG